MDPKRNLTRRLPDALDAEVIREALPDRPVTMMEVAAYLGVEGIRGVSP